MKRGSRLLALAIAVMAPAATSAAPPPPPPEFMGAIAGALTPNLTAENFDQYAKALADDLTVSINGKQVVASKAAWIAAERQKLGKVNRRMLAYSLGGDSVLVVDTYDDRSGLPTDPSIVFDPRPRTRATRYQVGPDKLVHAIVIVETDAFIRTTS